MAQRSIQQGSRREVDVSLVTSLYRANRHLPQYTTRALDLAKVLQRSDFSLELVLVANDASTEERELIANLQQSAHEIETLHVQVVFVDRETVYASWNRGVALSTSNCIGFGGVDDSRNPTAIINGVRFIKNGYELVDFPFLEVIYREYLGVFRRSFSRQHPAPFDPDSISPKTALSPFFLTSRKLYEQAGPFDGRFRVAGDFEWSARPEVLNARYCAGTPSGGTFFSHGGNLSGGVGNHREWAENNIVFIKNQQWESVRSVKPDVMREVCSNWNQEVRDVPKAVAEKLWGSEAETAWAEWCRKKRREQISEGLRWFPRLVIDTFGLRPLFARLGLVHTNKRGS